jgi:hypothetical protein
VNDGGYSPSKPHGFLSAPKQNSVARFVPVFTHTDTAVYFACLQTIDEGLAAAAVHSTFCQRRSKNPQKRRLKIPQ